MPGRHLAHFRFARAGIFHGLHAVGIGPGDEVLMPAYHHGIEVEAVRALGVSVRFYPLGAELRLDPEEVRRRIGARTRAVYVTHYFGFSQPTEVLRKLCDDRDLVLFEDCALSLFSEGEGVPLGSRGDLALFCLYKTLSLPDGALLALVPPLRGHRLRRFEHLRALVPRRREEECAGHPHLLARQLELAPSPLGRLLAWGYDPDHVRRQRRRNYHYWHAVLATLGGGLRPLHQNLQEGVCPLLFPALADDKSGLCRALLSSGIELANWWSTRRAYAGHEEGGQTDAIHGQLVGLPVHQELTISELEQVRQALARALNPTAHFARQ